MAPPDVPTDRLDRRAWAALLVLCGALFLDGLDVSMVGVALPSIDADLDLSTSTLQWVVSGYVLGYGGLLLLGGRAADLLGRRTVFITALAVFAGASLLGGLVSDGTLLIITRFIKGLAAAFTAPAGLSIITTSFAEGPARNKALAVYTATGASGFSFGLVMGGALTELGWRWTFLVPVPIAIALVFLALKFLAPDAPRPAASERRYDLVGAGLVTAAMLGLVTTVVRAPEVGWADPATIVGFSAVALLLAAFVAWEQRIDQPLVRLGILRTPGLVQANLAAMAVFGSYVAFQFLATLFLQQQLGWSAIETALAFLPAGLMVAFGAPRLGPVIDRYGTRAVMTAGLAAFTVGYLLFLRAEGGFSYAGVFFPSIVLIGLGFALAFPSLNVAATTGVADQEQGLASGLVNTSFQLGGAIVLAVTTAIVSSGGGTPVPGSDSLPDAYLPALLLISGVAAAGLGVVSARRRRVEVVPAAA